MIAEARLVLDSPRPSSGRGAVSVSNFRSVLGGLTGRFIDDLGHADLRPSVPRERTPRTLVTNVTNIFLSRAERKPFGEVPIYLAAQFVVIDCWRSAEDHQLVAVCRASRPPSLPKLLSEVAIAANLRPCFLTE